MSHCFSEFALPPSHADSGAQANAGLTFNLDQELEGDQSQMRIDRSFCDIAEDKILDIDQAASLANIRRSSSIGWDDLLKSQRILIVSEAGAGKTYECQKQRDVLWETGDAAFFVELAQLAHNSLREMLSMEEDRRLDAWLISQSDTATFFLDSVDELKLTLGSFKVALAKLSRALNGQFGRARIVITTRPTPVDQQLVRDILPTKEPIEEVVDAEKFALIALNKIKSEPKNRGSSQWRNVALLPLSNDQIRAIALECGVTDPAALLSDINRRHAQEFTRRPQDLIQLCIDWRDHKRIRTHFQQVAYDVDVKLRPRLDPGEKVQLSADRALEGASRLALGALLTRKLTLRHSAEADKGGTSEAALDPAVVLPDWTPGERETLLERALFGFASYGRVRFHHRSVVEYLAAERLKALLAKGMPFRALKRLLLAETAYAKKIVRPSLRPVAAWLSLQHEGLFEEIRDREPEVLLNFGDPESLTAHRRGQALRAYVDRYGRGGWRGMNVPWIQVQRFASRDLASEVRQLWLGGIENEEVRRLLLMLIDVGEMTLCTDIAYETAVHRDASDIERLYAIEALASLNDERLADLKASIEVDRTLWPHTLERSIALRLFPEHLRANQLCGLLRRLPQSAHAAGDISWQLPQIIKSESFTLECAEELRQGLTELLVESTAWESEWPHIISEKSTLAPALAASCLKLMQAGKVGSELARSIAISLRVQHRDYVHDEPLKELKSALACGSEDLRCDVFWANDAFVEGLHPANDSWMRFVEASFHGPIELNHNKDFCWVAAALTDVARPLLERTMMLEAAIRCWNGEGDSIDHLRRLQLFVADASDLVLILEQRQQPIPPNPDVQRMEKEAAKRHKQVERRNAKAHASWVQFWREVSDNPDVVFGPEREDDTAWSLWRAMAQAGAESRSSGWNRRFVERTFGPLVADRLRSTLMKAWRKDRPTLRSERPDEQKNTFLVRWQFGLAGIAAEAETRNWARELSPEDASLAARYTPIQMNGFPAWLEDLVSAHPHAVDAVLGEELSRELQEPIVAHQPSMTLQNISHSATSVIELFLPRLEAAVDQLHAAEGDNGSHRALADRLAQIVGLLLKHGNAKFSERLSSKAVAWLEAEPGGSVAQVWVSTLMRLDPAAGVARLESILADAGTSGSNRAEGWFATLFGDRYSIPLVDPGSIGFSPAVLLRLLRLAYQQVRPSDDIQHEGVYHPDMRDHAERGRNAILSALLDAKGRDAWDAKLAMANDPLFAHFRDRALAIAEERSAEEADAVPYDEAAVRLLDHYGETPPLTRDDMFAMIIDRLDDLEDLLLQDTSPRAAWALIQDETIMRREIARALRISANHAYTVDQEAVTADQKETDIRLRSTGSNQQSVIELKIGEKERSARELRNAIREQLVTKYMAPEECGAGCLLIITSTDRTWQHPETAKILDLYALIELLNTEVENIVSEMRGGLRLAVRGLNLRPRLAAEKTGYRSTKVKGGLVSHEFVQSGH